MLFPTNSTLSRQVNHQNHIRFLWCLTEVLLKSLHS